MIVIAYDIANDKARTKVSKILEDYGVRIQYSVFEADIPQHKFEEVLTKLEPLINIATDSLKVYFLCNNCSKNLRTIGVNKSYVQEYAIVI